MLLAGDSHSSPSRSQRNHVRGCAHCGVVRRQDVGVRVRRHQCPTVGVGAAEAGLAHVGAPECTPDLRDMEPRRLKPRVLIL